MKKQLAELIKEAKEKYIYSDEIAQYLIDRGVVIEKRGVWIEIDSDLGWVDGKCSVCGDVNCFDDHGFFPYCPNCGAKMDGERKQG